MQLLKLSASNSKFKTIDFKPGLNIVAGLQLSEDERKTINGIGKSFSLRLIHLLLGSKLKDEKILKFLSNYGTFRLSFTHKGETYLVEKNFANSDFFVNGEKISQTKYPKHLTEVLLGSEYSLPFRHVFNCFARRYGGSYYSDALTQQGQPINDYHQRFTNLFLLGIHTSLVQERFELKEKIGKLNKAAKAIEEYSTALETSNLNDLKDERDILISQKEKFIVAENYDSLKNQADILTVELNEIRNKIYEIEENIRRKTTALQTSININIDADKIEGIFNEAEFFFETKVKKRLEEAQAFHNNLVRNRKKRLEAEIKELTENIEDLKKILESKGKSRDLILKDLDNKGALEELHSLTARIQTLETEIRNLEKYKDMVADFKIEKSKLAVKSAHIKEESISYIQDSGKQLENLERDFRSIVKRFYDNHGGTLKLKETQDAKYLYDIEIHIPREGSQGVNEVKIFCFDVFLFLKNQKLLSFLAHDGCIFSEMDRRQKSMIFKIVLELIEKNNLQYFINIGQNSLMEILDEENVIGILTKKEKQIIKNSIRLELYDKNPENWLLGENFA